MQRNAPHLLILVSLVWFFILSFVAITSPFVIVLSDEAGYFLPSIFGSGPNNYLQWSILVAYPAYLYFWACSFFPIVDAHTYSRILNAGFIAATALPTYSLARRYISPALAAGFATVVMLSPISSFVRYVMPEPMYLFGFWCVVFVVITLLEKSAALSASLGGAMIGALSLVKPHAIALVLGLVAFFILRKRHRATFVAALMVPVAYYIVHVILGHLLTGEWLWSVSGSSYNGMISTPRIDLLASGQNLVGHTASILTLLTIPLAFTIFGIAKYLIDLPARSNNEDTFELGLLACCLLVAMVGMTVYFSQSVYQISPAERITRLHGRYYFYALPMFVLCAVAMCREATLRVIPDWLNALLFVSMSTAPMVIVAAGFEPSGVDFPDIALVAYRRRFIVIAILAAAAIAILGRKRPRNLVLLATVWWAVLGLATTYVLFRGDAYGVVDARRNSVNAAFADGIANYRLRGLIGRSDGIVVGPASNASDVYRAMFYLRSLSMGRITATNESLTDKDIPASVKWAVLVGGLKYVGRSSMETIGELTIVFVDTDNEK